MPMHDTALAFYRKNYYDDVGDQCPKKVHNITLVGDFFFGPTKEIFRIFPVNDLVFRPFWTCSKISGDETKLKIHSRSSSEEILVKVFPLMDQK